MYEFFFLPAKYMDSLKVLRVATRMLFDVIVVLDKKETDFQVGCKCKDITTANALQSMLARTLQDVDVSVLTKDDTIVVITPSFSSPASSPSEPSSPPTPSQGDQP
jgi:myosin-crossreactive antigen